MDNDFPGTESGEADKQQLKLAKLQGDAYKKALDEMASHEAHDGGMQEADDYLVAYAVEEAEGMYLPDAGGLQWQNPTNENAHIEIAVADRRDGRFIPELDVTVTLTDDSGKDIGTFSQPFLWHSWLYHYGRNWIVPASGIYTLKVEIAPPQFMRHDKGNGNRYAGKVVVTFEDVSIKTGQKKA